MSKRFLTPMVFGTAAIIGLSFTTHVIAINQEEEPIVKLIKFKITGNPSQVNPGAFTIGGPGYATITTATGEVLDNAVPGLEVAELSGAEIAFIAEDENPLDDYPVINFTCLASSCKITFTDGSVLESVADVPLAGRVATVWGHIANSDLGPTTTPMRILGCGGLREVAGEGQFAGMVGSICFNGVFNLPDFQTNFTLTGGSNCTITMHTPVVPLPY